MRVRKRILFVDDEPLVLDGLRRTLRKLRGDYDMEFAGGGEQALEIMETRPFDVIVTDMRMPGMNGAELLNRVMELYPGTIRLVLSGHADQDMIAKCHGVAHQFLSKPCDPDLLTRCILQAGQLNAAFDGKDMAPVLNRIERLPSLPSLYIELCDALAAEGTSTAALGDIIAQDVGMTAKILKLVNSAFFGLPRAISSPAEAVTYLGIETLRSLVLAHGIFGEARLATPHLTLQQLWSHSLAVAVGSRALARVLDPSGESQDAAFSGGLLHDVGVLILAYNFPEQYEGIVDHVCQTAQPLPETELQSLGIRHEEVGAYLMGLWGLPTPIIRGILHHHRPMKSPNENAVASIHLSSALVGAQGRHPLWKGQTVEPEFMNLPHISGHWGELVNCLRQGMGTP